MYVLLYRGVGVSPNRVMVVDQLVQKNRQQTAMYFALAFSLIILHSVKAKAQSSSVDYSSSHTIFLKDKPSPKATYHKMSRVKAKPAVRNFSTFGIDDGLALQSVLSGYKDLEGNLWFATGGGGVSKFDGGRFFNFDERHGLGNGLVRAITQDKSGTFYFGTRTGLSIYDGVGIKNYYVTEGFPARPIASLIVDTLGQVWCGTQGAGLVKFDGKHFKTYSVGEGLPSKHVRSLLIDNKGILWIGTQDGVWTFDGIEFQSFRTPEHQDKTVYDIHQDSRGNIWFACAEAVLKFDGTALQVFSKKDGVSASRILCIGEGGDGAIWFGTLDGGVMRYDGNSFEGITMSDGLPSNRVWGIVTDADGNVWFCSQGGGVSRYNGNSLVSFTTQQGLAHNLVWCIAEDTSGKIWFGHDNGISNFDGDYFSSLSSRDSLFHFFAIATDADGNAWGGGRQGLVKWDGQSLVQYTERQGLSSNQINDIVTIKSDAVWIATEVGVSRFDGEAFTNFTLEKDSNECRVARVYLDRNQVVWATTVQNVFKYNEARAQFERVDMPGLPSNFSATAIVQDKQGYYWISSRSGLVRFDGKFCKLFTYSEGLPNDHIFDIKLDPVTQDLWMGTNQGLIKLSFKDGERSMAAGHLTVDNLALQTFEAVWSEYNRNTGYPLDDLNHPALFISDQSENGAGSKSTIWAGFADKLYRFNAAEEERKPKATKILISHLKLDGQVVSWRTIIDPQIEEPLLSKAERLVLGKILTKEARTELRKGFKNVHVRETEKFSGLPMGLILSHRFDQITFDFGAIETSHNALINYQYRLRGSQEEWSYPSKNRSATFTHPWEGSYVFEVRAQIAGGPWTDPVQFSFSVLPPWWRTYPMYFAYAITFAFIFLIIVKLRERKLRGEKQFLEKVISERTNEVMEQMRSVELQKQEAQKQKHEAERQRNIVEEKNREIAKQLADTEANLSNLTLQMIQRFHAYSELEQELKKIAETSDSKKYQRAFSLLTMNKSLDKEWEQFNFYFNGIYKEFNNKLRELAPQLSNYDLRMCALIKMGLENREIAMLLNIEASSVKMAKYRLKKKFNIEESVSLKAYFESL